MNGCGRASTKVMVVFLSFSFPTKSSIAKTLQPAGTAESAGLDGGEALQTQASTEDVGKEQQQLPLGVLKGTVEFTLAECFLANTILFGWLRPDMDKGNPRG